MKPTVFVGSSSEGARFADALAIGLEQRCSCEVQTWREGVFKPSSYVIPALVERAKEVDFAVLIATADDQVTTRGQTYTAARDNVVFELGLFIGALGLERTYYLPVGGADLHFPSDWNGLTYLPFTHRVNDEPSASLRAACVQLADRVEQLGPRSTATGPPPASTSITTSPPLPASDKQTAQPLDIAIGRLIANAEAQGWTVKQRDLNTVRFFSPTGRRHTLVLDGDGPWGDPWGAVRTFANKIRGDGLRVHRSLRQRPNPWAGNPPF